MAKKAYMRYLYINHSKAHDFIISERHKDNALSPIYQCWASKSVKWGVDYTDHLCAYLRHGLKHLLGDLRANKIDTINLPALELKAILRHIGVRLLLSHVVGMFGYPRAALLL